MKYGQTKTVKLYYTISEVVDLTGVPAHILRYWEQEFTMLRPRKNRAGNRTYKDRDIALIRRIQKLIQVECYTIEGALRRLREIGDIELESSDVLDDSAPSLEVHEQDVADEFTSSPNLVLTECTTQKQTLLESLREIRELLK